MLTENDAVWGTRLPPATAASVITLTSGSAAGPTDGLPSNTACPGFAACMVEDCRATCRAMSE